MSVNYYYGFHTKFYEMGRYLRKIKDKQVRIHICSDNLYINATVEVLLSREFSYLMRLEVAVNDDFPYTLYI